MTQLQPSARRLTLWACAASALMGLAAEPVQAQSPSAEQRLIVTYRQDPRMRVLSASTPRPAWIATQRLQSMRVLATGSHLFQVPSGTSREQAEDMARVIRQDPSVLAVEFDQRVRATSVSPAEALYAQQWALQQATPASPGSAGLSSFWARTLGAQSTVAVLDGGLVAHPQFAAGSVIGGHDFVSDTKVSGDGDGRDADATDVGDYCPDTAPAVDSRWHGTRVAGIVAAPLDGVGSVGAAPRARLLNVRVLGRCTGWTSDVVDGMLWSAGIAVTGAPAHGQGPVVLNLSLSTFLGLNCPVFMQKAVDQVNQAGSIIVAAAGNEAQADKISSPANCTGVVAVTAHTRSADLAEYANFSPQVTVSAPGGGRCRTMKSEACLGLGILTLGVKGKTTLEGYTGPEYFFGTSAAAPVVAGLVALMKEIKPSLKADQVISILRNNSRDWPAGSTCHQNPSCGFGMLDAEKVLRALDDGLQPTVTAAVSSPRVALGTPITIKATPQSPVAGTTWTYEWRQLGGPVQTWSGQGDEIKLTGGTSAGQVVMSVTVMDAGRRQASATVTVELFKGTAPEFVTVADQRLEAGRAWNLAPTVRDADGDFTRITVLEGPAGVQSTGKELVWAAPVEGQYKLKLQAVDAAGLESAPITVNLTVAAAAGATAGPINGADPAGPAGSSGGSGGGSTGWLGVVLMAAAGLYRRRLESDAPVAAPSLARAIIWVLAVSITMAPSRAHLDEFQAFDLATEQRGPASVRDPFAGPTKLALQAALADDWYLDRVNLTGSLPLTSDAAELVAVIDSGVDETHPALQGRIVQGWNFTNGTHDTRDERGHGTAVASVIALAHDAWAQRSGQALRAQIMPLKVTDAQGRATPEMMAAAIRYAADQGVRVVNISFNGLHRSRMALESIDYLRQRGGVAVLSAGNDDRYLGALSPVAGLMTVGATNHSNRRAFFSNKGAALTVVAPGTPIWTAQASTTGMNWREGTSLSAPLVSAAMALLMSSGPGVTAEMAQQAIMAGAMDLGPAGFDDEYGHGLLNFSRSAEILQSGPRAKPPARLSIREIHAIDDRTNCFGSVKLPAIQSGDGSSGGFPFGS